MHSYKWKNFKRKASSWGEFGYMFTRDSEGLTDRIWSEVSSTNALVTRYLN